MMNLFSAASRVRPPAPTQPPPNVGGSIQNLMSAFKSAAPAPAPTAPPPIRTSPVFGQNLGLGGGLAGILGSGAMPVLRAADPNDPVYRKAMGMPLPPPPQQAPPASPPPAAPPVGIMGSGWDNSFAPRPQTRTSPGMASNWGHGFMQNWGNPFSWMRQQQPPPQPQYQPQPMSFGDSAPAMPTPPFGKSTLTGYYG